MRKNLKMREDYEKLRSNDGTKKRVSQNVYVRRRQYIQIKMEEINGMNKTRENYEEKIRKIVP